MPATIKIDALSNEIMNQLSKYDASVDETVQNEITSKSKQIVKDLKNNPNIPQRDHQGKHYKKSFYIKQIARGKGYIRLVVANRKYQLTHLLEYGHANRNGKRSKSFPHWNKAQKQVDDIMNDITRRLSQ